MFVITADQIDSRNDRDRAGELIAELSAQFGGSFDLPPDQTSGDEIQILTTDARAAFNTVLAIHRTGHWSTGLGIGSVRTPLPAATRQAAGSAFIAARDAVNRSKKTDARFALEASLPAGAAAGVGVGAGVGASAGTDAGTGAASGTDAGADASLSPGEVEALISMLLLLRQRRTPEGWDAVDLLEQGLNQSQAASRLGVTTAAVSQRVKSAMWRVEESARPALVRLLGNLDRATTETEPAE
ncbi:MAG: DNA-binding protein [Microbacteriaceae bacterium]|nr:DNA-binding protein [Microbacteriaceae bacterium]